MSDQLKKKRGGVVTHGARGTRLYRIWANMRQRCANRNNHAYQYYGGKGIDICVEWNDFQCFMNWAVSSGYRDDLSIDRIDNDRGYSPLNCRWVDKYTQASNRGTMKNNLCGAKGVKYSSRDKVFISRIQVKGNLFYLGSFATIFDAVAARKSFENLARSAK